MPGCVCVRALVCVCLRVFTRVSEWWFLLAQFQTVGHVSVPTATPHYATRQSLCQAFFVPQQISYCVECL